VSNNKVSADYYREVFVNLATLSTEDESMKSLLTAEGVFGDLQRTMIDAAINSIMAQTPQLMEMMNMFKICEIEAPKAARFMYLTGVRTPEIGGFNG
jgi:hypothetical protein